MYLHIQLMFVHDIGGRQKLSGKMVNMWQILIEMVVVYWAYVDLSLMPIQPKL